MAGNTSTGANGQREAAAPRRHAPSWMVGAGVGVLTFALVCAGIVTLILNFPDRHILPVLATTDSPELCEIVIEGTDAEQRVLLVSIMLVLPGSLAEAWLGISRFGQPIYSAMLFVISCIPFALLGAILASKAMPRLISVSLTIAYAVLAAMAGLVFSNALVLYCRS